MDTVIAELQKSPLDKLVVSVREYRGHRFADVRLHFLGEDEQWHPTRRGVTVSPDLWDEFMEAVAKVGVHLAEADAPHRRRLAR